ncbi:MAG: hypothetical protein K2X27_03510 [Candidatus Obscuribacterales bacterium]|nr:hypothetical protein [Candidatus Obscuribacterales bacterium]
MANEMDKKEDYGLDIDDFENGCHEEIENPDFTDYSAPFDLKLSNSPKTDNLLNDIFYQAIPADIQAVLDKEFNFQNIFPKEKSDPRTSNMFDSKRDTVDQKERNEHFERIKEALEKEQKGGCTGEGGLTGQRISERTAELLRVAEEINKRIENLLKELPRSYEPKLNQGRGGGGDKGGPGKPIENSAPSAPTQDLRYIVPDPKKIGA